MRGLEGYINRISLNGKIWCRVWSNCILHSCHAYNKYDMLQKKVSLETRKCLIEIFIQFLAEINFYRKIHRSSPIVLDLRLTRKLRILLEVLELKDG
uniref:PiggyBac transposable element-derived protein domain-containing protein n=1 Tax=Strongyloides venezuelensis TaxID=75913 RepID=A0A0K0G205_STRVS